MTALPDDADLSPGDDSDRLDLSGPAFRALSLHVLDPLAEQLARGEVVRVWVPGCGDGTMAFALTLALLERVGGRISPTQLRVFATDVDPKRIAVASQGQLDRRQARAFIRAGFRRRFAWTGKRWQVRPSVRGRIVFSVHDALRDTAFGHVDLVFARGLAERVSSACQICVLKECLRALNPGGWFIVEPLQRVDQLFTGLHPIAAEHGIYRVGRNPSPWRTSRFLPPASEHWNSSELVERISEHFAPTALVVDEVGKVRGATRRAAKLLLQSAPRQPCMLSIATRPQTREGLLNAFVRALRTGATTSQRMDHDDRLAVAVTSLSRTQRSRDALWLLRIREHSSRDVDASVSLPLREHLVATAETLKRAMEEAANHNLALKTTNDALQSTIDELEGSNRRFASMNTELIAVRHEHEKRIAELDALNLDVENLLRAANLVLVVLDGDGRLRRYTPAAARLFRLARTDLGRPLAELVPAGMSDLLGALDEALGAAKADAQLPIDFPSGGERRTGLARVRAFLDDDGKQMGAILTITDISELKAAEDVLREQNVALTRANEDLERFAYIASHDLKSPLRSVRTMLEFLRSDLGDALTGENRDHLDLVAVRVQQMEQMIQDLLAYSRLGRENVTAEDVSVRDLVQSQVGLLHVPAGFEITLGEDLPRLTTDAGLFEHVVRNLIENAIKHHDQETGRITFRAVAAAPIPTFEVVDDGPGIPERYHERIFEIFQKAAGRGEQSGSGMGLALVKKAVERNGGTITVESGDAERGTTFRFTWPERKVAQSPAQTA